MISLLFKTLAIKKPILRRSVIALFIAGEEGAEMGVGVDMVVQAGEIDELKNGSCYWIDCADSQPCLGTAGALQWHLKATGRLFHSGLPHRGINSIELVSEALGRYPIYAQVYIHLLQWLARSMYICKRISKVNAALLTS